MTQRKPAKRPRLAAQPDPKPTLLLADSPELILQARESAWGAVDSGLTNLYWHFGRRIRQGIIGKEGADYGGEIVALPMRQFASKRRIERTPLDSQLSRDYYAEICWVDGWGVRTQRPTSNGCAKRRVSGRDTSFITAHPSGRIAASFLCR